MNQKLKPCPFCNSDDISLEIAGYCWWVVCRQCGGRARTQFTKQARKRQSWYETEDKISAINQWNSRNGE